MPRRTLRWLALAGATAALAGCGTEEMFEPQLGGTEQPINRVEVARYVTDDLALGTPVVVGDLDGDGIADAVVTSAAAIYVDPGQLLQLVTRAYVLYGGSAVHGAIDVATLPSLTELGEPFLTIAAVGDVDGDGLADFVVTSRQLPPGVKIWDPPTPSGAYLVYGSRTRLTGATPLSSAGLLFHDTTPGSAIPTSAALGDLDGDGLGDFAIGTGTGVAGVPATIFIIYGRRQRPAAPVELASAADAVISVSGGSPYAPDIAGVGDIDGDGRGDFLVGTMTKDPSADAYLTDLRLVRGRAARLAGPVELRDIAATQLIADEQPVRWLRFEAALGDLDGDGRDDFALASVVRPAAMTAEAIAQKVFYGRAGGFPAVVSSSQADATLILPGNTRSHVAAGDVDGDGRRDLLVGDQASHAGDGSLHVLVGDGTRLSGTIDVAARSTTYVGAPRHATNCDFAGAGCVVHEAVGGGVNAVDLTGDHRAQAVVNATGIAITPLGVHGSSNDRIYVLSLPASARP